MSDLEERTTKAEERATLLQEKLVKLIQDFKLERTTNQTTVEELQNELQGEKEQNAVLSEKLVKVVEMLKAERKQREDQKLQEVQQDGVGRTTRENSLKEVTLQTNLEKSKKELEQSKKDLEKAEEEKSQAKRELERLKRQTQRTQLEEEERFEAEKKKLKGEVEKQKTENQTLITENDELQDSVRNMRKELNKTKRELEEHKTQVLEISAKLKSSARTEDKSFVDAAAFEKKLQLLQEEKDSLRTENAKHLKAAEDAATESEEAKSKAEVFETKLAALVKVLRELKDERTKWLQTEEDLKAEISTLKSKSADAYTPPAPSVNDNGRDEDSSTTIQNVFETIEYKAAQGKLHDLETQIKSYTSQSSELQQEVTSLKRKLALSENTCDKLRDELEKTQNQASSAPIASPPPPPAPAGPPGLPPPPPPPPPAFKKPSGKLEIKRSAKPPPSTGKADEGSNLKAQLLDEITKGVTLRKVQPIAAQPKPANNPQSPDGENSMFALGAMASMLAKKRMARLSMRIEADDPLKGSLDTLLMELGNK